MTRQVLVINGGHYSSFKFITYSADRNEWKQIPVDLPAGESLAVPVDTYGALMFLACPVGFFDPLQRGALRRELQEAPDLPHHVALEKLGVVEVVEDRHGLFEVLPAQQVHATERVGAPAPPVLFGGFLDRLAQGEEPPPQVVERLHGIGLELLGRAA